MISVPDGVLITEHLEGRRWITYTGSSGSRHGVERDLEGDLTTVDAANQLAHLHGGVAVRCVVVIDHHWVGPEPRVLCTYPRHVHLMTRRMALGYAVTPEI